MDIDVDYDVDCRVDWINVDLNLYCSNLNNDHELIVEPAVDDILVVYMES